MIITIHTQYILLDDANKVGTLRILWKILWAIVRARAIIHAGRNGRIKRVDEYIYYVGPEAFRVLRHSLRAFTSVQNTPG